MQLKYTVRILAHEGRLLEAIPKMERGVASRRRRLVTVGTGRPRDPVRRALRPGCEELAARIRSKCRRRKRGTGAQNRHGGAPRGERLPRDARRLARRLACRVKARPRVPEHPSVISALRHPSFGCAKPQQAKPGRKNAPRERRNMCCLTS